MCISPFVSLTNMVVGKAFLVASVMNASLISNSHGVFVSIKS